MNFRWILIALVCLFVAPAAASKKFGKQVRYVGIHPIPKGEGGGICHIEYPHVHVYAANKLEYRVYEDNNVFVGDPVAYGWDGPKYAYKGHHPIQVNAVVGGPEPYVQYCYINGPHYHYWEPEGPDYKVAGGAYFYVGTPAPAYVEARPAYIGINAVYEPIVYTRPVVEVEPPSGWIGVGVVAPAPVVVAPHGRVHVSGPAVGVGVVGPAVGVGVGVHVHVPAPPVIGIGVHVGGPAVIVGGGAVVHGKMKHKKFKRH